MQKNTMQRSQQLSVEIIINENTMPKELISVNKIVTVSHRIAFWNKTLNFKLTPLPVNTQKQQRPHLEIYKSTKLYASSELGHARLILAWTILLQRRIRSCNYSPSWNWLKCFANVTHCVAAFSQWFLFGCFTKLDHSISRNIAIAYHCFDLAFGQTLL